MAAKMTNYGNDIEGLRAALRALPKESKTELKKASKDIASDVATDAKQVASGLVGRSGAWKYVGPTIRAGAAQEPNVKIGGSKRLAGSPGYAVGDLLWGLEFGGRAKPTTQQFLPHLGRTGYALWPTVRRREDDTANRYSEALLAALEAI